MNGPGTGGGDEREGRAKPRHQSQETIWWFPVSQMARWKNEVGEEDFKMILIGLRQYDIFKASCHVRFLRLFYQEFGVTNESPE